jgi:hypothetical protein
MLNTAPKPLIPRRFLTDDIVEEFGKTRFRIRIWQGRDATPIVLVSQVPGGTHPRSHATQVANWINGAMLSFPDAGFLYFEDGVSHGQRYLAHLVFEYFGNEHRLRLFKPEPRPKDWSFFEHVIGSPVER